MNEPTTSSATTVKTTFSRTTSVASTIPATPEKLWGLLTDAANYPIWNSTITSIEGTIALGQTIKLKSTLDAKRTFKLKIGAFEPSTKLVWGDAVGNRVYTLADNGDGTTGFSMVEKIGGPIFPLFASKIPSFDESFNMFAADLKAAAAVQS